MCDLAVYLMTELSFSYGIIMNTENNVPWHGKNAVDELKTMNERYLKEQMETIGKLASNDTSNIGIIPGASKDVFI